MAEHGKPWHGYQQGTYTKVLVPIPKLGDGSFFIWVIHEVNEPFKNLRVKVERILNGLTIFLVFLILEHVHKCAVVHAMHSQGADKVSFHHPERFCKQ